MTGVYVDSIKDKSNTKTLATLSSSAVTMHSDVTFPAGHVIQTAYATDGTHFVLASHNSMTEISTDFRVTITPKSTSNKLIMQFHMPVADGGTTQLWNFQFYDVTGTDVPEPKSASQISGHEEGWGHRGPHSDSNDHDVVRGFFIANAPRTTSTVYTVRAKNNDGTGEFKVNYSATQSDWGFQGVTTFMVQEIQG